MYKFVGGADQKVFARSENMKKLLIGGLGEGYGGVSNVIMTYLRNVDRSQFNISVIETYDSVYHDEIVSLGFEIIRLPVFKKYFKYKKAVRKLFKDRKFDVVWITHNAKVAILTLKYAQCSGPQVITHSHGTVQEGSRLKRCVFEFINKLHEKKFYSYMDLGVACSQSSATYFYNAKYLKNKEVFVLPNAIDCKKYEYSCEKRIAAREILNARDADIVLACIGRVCDVKNLDFALKIMPLLPDKYKLVIIGGGDARTLQAEVARTGLDNRVSFLGARSDVDLLMNGVDMLLLPSLSEGLPMIVLEAQANGVKCIISDRVSSECKVLESAEFATICDESVWADIIKRAETERTENAATILTEGGFDVATYSQKLSEWINHV